MTAKTRATPVPPRRSGSRWRLRGSIRRASGASGRAQRKAGERVAGFRIQTTDRSTIVVWERIRQTLIERWVIAEPGGFSCSSRASLPVYDPLEKRPSACCRRASSSGGYPLGLIIGLTNKCSQSRSPQNTSVWFMLSAVAAGGKQYLVRPPRSHVCREATSHRHRRHHPIPSRGACHPRQLRSHILYHR